MCVGNRLNKEGLCFRFLMHAKKFREEMPKKIRNHTGGTKTKKTAEKRIGSLVGRMSTSDQRLFDSVAIGNKMAVVSLGVNPTHTILMRRQKKQSAFSCGDFSFAVIQFSACALYIYNAWFCILVTNIPWR